MVCLLIHFLSEPWVTFCVAVFFLCFSVPCFEFLIKLFKPVFCSQVAIKIPPCDFNYAWKAEIDNEAFEFQKAQPAPKPQGVICLLANLFVFSLLHELSYNYVCFSISSFNSFALISSFLCYLSLTLLNGLTLFKLF